MRDAWRIARDIIESPEGKRGEGYRQQYLSFTEEMRQQIWGVVLEKIQIQKIHDGRRAGQLHQVQ